MVTLLFFLLHSSVVLEVSCALITSYSVAGLGSGASFAHQLHTAFGTTVQAAGLVAPSPYFCSMGSYAREVSACRVNSYLFSLQSSIFQFTSQGTDGNVDPSTSLSNDRAYIISGTGDTFTSQETVKNTEAFYRTFIHNNYKIYTNYSIPAGHAWITDSYGGPCWSSGPPFIVNCGFDLAGDMLKHLTALQFPRTAQISAHLHSFDQSKYGDVWQAGMSSRGFVYLPGFCVNNTGCKVVTVFHGCHQNYDHVGDVFVKETGFNEWAESNDFIIIYPQTIATQENPAGCWDTWGYTGPNFSVQSGLQMKLVHGISLNPPFLNWTSLAVSK
jgi:hypothetical protein